MTRLWDKGLPLDERVLRYTAGEDHKLDARLVPYDVRGSIAHAGMLAATKLSGNDDFEAIRDGRLKLDQRVRVSRHAARQVPSKIGLRRGQKVTIRHLIRAAAIKSANDAAVALAEAMAPSEADFAEMMTIRARQLGMTSTTFRNVSGLTAKGQRSTARAGCARCAPQAARRDPRRPAHRDHRRPPLRAR